MTQLTDQAPSPHIVEAMSKYIDSIKEDLWTLNQEIHDNPEPAFEEHKAHDSITEFLEKHGRQVTRHAYNLDTAFESLSGHTGHLINFNAEYDALPGLGHACGHNLICIASVAAYLALSQVLEDCPESKGRTQLLGTPAEEGGGGKIKLLDAGAYKGVDVSLMAHPSSELAYTPTHHLGIAGQPTLAVTDLLVTYTGRSAHAAANPWDGINALDAVIASYSNISLLRQQLHPTDRIHGAIISSPKITNAIPAHTAMKYTIRSTTLKNLHLLVPRVEACLSAAALATGCTMTINPDMPTYADVKPNLPLSSTFAAYMSQHEHIPLLTSTTEPIPASTDQGNVTHAVPGLHAIVGVDVGGDETAFPHNEAFERVSGRRESFERFIKVAKGLAVTGARVCSDEGFLRDVWRDFRGEKAELESR